MAMTAAERSKRWRERHPEQWKLIYTARIPQMREILARWRQENPEKFNAQMKRHRDKNPDHFRAYRQFKRALKSGELVRPDRCQHCQKPCKPDSHHHNGYENPLDVLWLCRKCHVSAHRSQVVENNHDATRQAN